MDSFSAGGMDITSFVLLRISSKVKHSGVVPDLVLVEAVDHGPQREADPQV